MKRVLVLVLALLALACGKKPKNGGQPLVGGLGTRIAGGLVTDLRTSPDGKTAAYLKESSKPRLEGVPPTMRVGELHVVHTAGGEPHKLGNGVSNFPGGYLFTPDSKWVLELVGYNAADQMGELDVAPIEKGDAEKIGSRVSYMLPSPDSKWVAFVDDGILKLGRLPAGPFRSVNGDVSNAAFTPDSSQLFFKRRAASGGSLLVTRVDDPRDSARKLGDLVGDYRLTPDGKHIAFASKASPSDHTFRLYVADTATLKDVKVADQVFDFKFSPDGKLLARLEGTSPEAGGELFVGSADGKDGGKKLGATVRDFAFSPDLKFIVYRDSFTPDRAEGRGTLMLAPLSGGDAKLIGKWCRSYEWAPDSKSIAFTFERTKPLLSVDLYLHKIGEADPVKLKEWAYDYDFTPDSTRLLFRSDCVREGRACNLLSVDATQPKNPPKKLIEGVYGFRLSQDGSHVLFTYARTQGGDLYDTGVLNMKSGDFKTLEQQIRMPPYFLSDDGTKVAYIVAEQKREGVYVADKVP